MGGMKSGTGDVWDDEDDEERETDAADADVDDEDAASETVEDAESETAADAASAENADVETETTAGSDDRSEEGSTTNDAGASDASDAGDTSTEQGGDAGASETAQPYVVRRMLKDRSVQFERDERLTFFVHDDVKAGEQELEAEAQDLFGRDIPVFDIREAVYRAALRNRDDVVDELEEMGYTRD